MSYEVRTLPLFEKEFKRLNIKYPSLKSDLPLLINHPEVNPFEGTSLGKNLYKIGLRIRISSKGIGKSGEARIISCVKS